MCSARLLRRHLVQDLTGKLFAAAPTALLYRTRYTSKFDMICLFGRDILLFF